MNSLPYLQILFEKLKLGYHISRTDAELHAALTNDFESYFNYFAAIGLTIRKHERDFFYLEPEEDDFASERLAKVAAFSFILIDHTATQGLPIEQTLMTAEFSLRGMPHLKVDSYRARMNQVGIYELADLKRVIDYLKNIGWARWVDDEEFVFLRPFHRIFSKCVELSEQCASANEQERVMPTAAVKAPETGNA